MYIFGCQITFFVLVLAYKGISYELVARERCLTAQCLAESGDADSEVVNRIGIFLQS